MDFIVITQNLIRNLCNYINFNVIHLILKKTTIIAHNYTCTHTESENIKKSGT